MSDKNWKERALQRRLEQARKVAKDQERQKAIQQTRRERRAERKKRNEGK